MPWRSVLGFRMTLSKFGAYGYDIVCGEGCGHCLQLQICCRNCTFMKTLLNCPVTCLSCTCIYSNTVSQVFSASSRFSLLVSCGFTETKNIHFQNSLFFN